MKGCLLAWPAASTILLWGVDSRFLSSIEFKDHIIFSRVSDAPGILPGSATPLGQAQPILPDQLAKIPSSVNNTPRTQTLRKARRLV